MIGNGVAHHIFSIICVREANSNWLVDEEDVCVGVPSLWMESAAISVQNPAWAYIDNEIGLSKIKDDRHTKFHE